MYSRADAQLPQASEQLRAMGRLRYGGRSLRDAIRELQRAVDGASTSERADAISGASELRVAMERTARLGRMRGL